MKIIKALFANNSFFRKRGKFVKHTKIKNSSNPGIHNRLKFHQHDKLDIQGGRSNEFDDMQEDVDYLESDFMKVHESYNDYNRELKWKKETLKTQITLEKYVKETEPSFLTFAEKERIKLLHAKDPEEWTIEQLSKSFPALPHTIKKVLHAKWTPKSKEKILNYDAKVFNNWEEFKTGKLSVDPNLKKHLENFSDRQIILSDRDKLVKSLLHQEIQFPKPESKLFSSIAKKCFLSDGFETRSSFKTRKTNNHEILEDVNEAKQDRPTNVNVNVNVNVTEMQSLVVSNRAETNKPSPDLHKVGKAFLFRNLRKDINEQNKPLTFDQFLKNRVSRTQNSSTRKSIVLKETYKNEVENTALYESKSAAATNPVSESSKEDFFESESVINSKANTGLKKEEMNFKSNAWISKTESNTSNSIVPENDKLSVEFDKGYLQTYVKEFETKSVNDVEIAPYIQIPKHRYKKGMTYKVKDCFYDDDGEFLFRVPGLLE